MFAAVFGVIKMKFDLASLTLAVMQQMEGE